MKREPNGRKSSRAKKRWRRRARWIQDSGTFKNVAVVLTSESKGDSDEVEVELEQASAFEVIKEQRLAGEKAYTTAKLVGKAPATVEYKVVVKNTGATALEVEGISDADAPGCNWAGETGETSAGRRSARGDLLGGTRERGRFKNAAIVGVNDTERVSNEVESVLEGGTTSFELIKEQRFAGEKAFTKSKLVGKAPATVEYEIVVKNTGGTTLDVEKVGDGQVPACDQVAKQPDLAPGEEEVEAECSAEYKASGKFKNAAIVFFTTTEGFTNEVEVELEPVTSFEVLKGTLRGRRQLHDGQADRHAAGDTGTYRSVVKNTGETTIEVLKLLDANAPGCQTTPAKPEVEPGQEAVEATCTVEHKTAGVFKNSAFVVTKGREERSNEVEAELSESAVETFEVVKEKKKLAGNRRSRSRSCRQAWRDRRLPDCRHKHRRREREVRRVQRSQLHEHHGRGERIESGRIGHVDVRTRAHSERCLRQRSLDRKDWATRERPGIEQGRSRSDRTGHGVRSDQEPASQRRRKLQRS